LNISLEFVKPSLFTPPFVCLFKAGNSTVFKFDSVDREKYLHEISEEEEALAGEDEVFSPSSSQRSPLSSADSPLLSGESAPGHTSVSPSSRLKDVHVVSYYPHVVT
jgi:hypothetical protein